MTPLARLRRLWLDVHLWIGAGLLIVLMPLAVTGSVLVWHDQIDHALYASRYATSGGMASLPVSAYADAAQQAFGDRAQLTQIRFPQQPGDPVVAVGRMKGPVPQGGVPRALNAWMDPPNARVLGAAEVNAQATMVIHRLHGSLLIPDIGREVVGWLGWAMFVSSATGAWLWWPRHGGFRKGLRWHRGGSTLFNLHHLIGFWISLPLAVLSLTGVYIAFPLTSHALFGAPVSQQRPGGAGRNAQPITPRMNVDAAAAAAGGGAVAAAVREVNYPVGGKAPTWRITLDKGGGDGVSVRVVDATAEAKSGLDGSAGSPRQPDPTSKFMRQVHDGTDMGLVWRLIITIVGAAPAILGVTGVIMWLRRRARRRAVTRGRA